MNRNDAELWGGGLLVVVGVLVLFAPLFLALRYDLVLFVVAVAALAAGSLLVGLSRRGRAA